MAAKGTRVTQQEKEKMWQLYQEGCTFVKIAHKMRRAVSTVSRYVHEYEAAVAAAGYVRNSEKGSISNV